MHARGAVAGWRDCGSRMMNGALYCLLRVHLVSKAALGPDFSGGLLLMLGLLSVLVAMPFILIQWNLKRLLAYSSIEHVGIMAIGIDLGSEAAVFGALLRPITRLPSH
jgi:hydrogenase-4 component F